MADTLGVHLTGLTFFKEEIIAMAFVKTVLICMCERCGYGRADHPKTVEKPWAATVRPKYCEGCGSPNWDAQRRSWARFVGRAKSRVDRIGSALGFRRMLASHSTKIPRQAVTNMTRNRRSPIELIEALPRDRTVSEPRTEFAPFNVLS